MWGRALWGIILLSAATAGGVWGQPVISSLQASRPFDPPSNVNGITAQSGTEQFTLYVNGTFDPAASTTTLNWADPNTGITTTFSPISVTASQLTFAINSFGIYDMSVSSPVPVGITVTQDAGTSNKLTFFINPQVSIPVVLPDATLGKPYSAPILAGGTAPYSVNLNFGALPPGITLAATSDKVTGTPISLGIFQWEYSVFDFWSSGVNAADYQIGVFDTPTVTSVSPTSAIAGQPNGVTLTVNGTNFVAAQPAFDEQGTAVQWTFGEISITLVSVFVNSNQMTVFIPASMLTVAGTASIAAIQPSGAVSTGLPFNILSPAITSLSPTNSPVGSPTITLAVSGSSFVSGAVVSFNGNALTTVFSNAALLTATVPSTLLTTAGNFPVIVTNPGGYVSNTVLFPLVTGPSIVTPALPPATIGTGYAFTLTGTSGTTPYTWAVSGLPAGLGINAASGLISGIPTASGSFPLKVTLTDFNSLTANATFTLNISVPALLTSLSPNSIPAGSSAITITLNGSNFVPADVATAQPSTQAQWKFGTKTTPLATTFINTTQLTASVPASLLTVVGTASVTAVQPSGVSSTGLSFDVAAPAISSLSPPNAAVGSPDVVLSVSGSSFVSGAVINFNGNALPTAFGNSTLLTATVPAALMTSPGSFPITVTNPGGFVSNSVPFPVLVGPRIITSTLPPGTTGTAYTFTLTGASGTTPYMWAATGLPAGLGIDSAKGLISGTPTAAGSFPVNITLTDFNKFSTGATFTLNISLPPLLTSISPNGTGAGSPAITITLNGSNFVAADAATGQPSSQAQWTSGGILTPLTTTFVSASQLTASLPASLLTSAGTATVAVVQPSNVNSAGLPFTIGGPAITSLTPSTALAGSPTFTLTVNGSGFVFARGLPAQSVVSFNGTPLTTTFVNSTQLTAAVPAGLITVPGTYPVLVTNPGGAASAPFNFTVGASLAITTASLPSGVAGKLYSVALAAKGGVPPYTWGATGLPPGVGITPATGVIAGVPAQSATGNIAITVKDSAGSTVSTSLALSIGAPAVTFSPSNSLPTGTVGVPYAGLIAANGGTNDFTFTLSGGSLPDGLTLASGGSVIGTPRTPGIFNFSVLVNDGAGGTLSGSFSILINPAPLTVPNPAGPTSGVSGTPITITFTGGGGIAPYRCSATGTLPPGLTFAACTLSGTPTAPGTFTIHITITDRTGTSTTRDFAITIAPPALTLGGSLAAGQVGVAYSGGVTAAGGIPPYSYSIGGLPDGLNAASAGAISGTPTAAGDFTVSAAVTDSAGAKANASFRVTIAPADLAITTISLPNGAVSGDYTVSLSASGGVRPYTWSFSGLPEGLTGNAAGLITGTPKTAGSLTVTVTVKDASGASTTARITFTIAAAPITITSVTLASGTVGSSYSAALGATGGVPPFTWSAAGLAPGLTISTSGTIAGTPIAPGTFTVNVTVKDSAGTTVTKAFPITVALPPVPALNFGGISSTSNPLQQPHVSLSLANPFPVDVTVTLTLTFAPDSGPDDPSIVFSTGGRTAKITIPAGTAVGLADVGVQTGTVAGLITITAQMQAAGLDVTPSPAPQRTIRIAALAPVPTAATATRTSTGFTVTVTGYVTDREMTQAIFTFNGTNLQTTTLTVAIDTLFSQYFGSPAAAQFGGQFTFTQPFNISGNTSSITSVTVVLVNKIGQSTSITAIVQ